MFRMINVLLLAMLLTGSGAVLADSSDMSPQEERQAYWDGRAGGTWTEAELNEQAAAQLKSELYSVQLWLERWALGHELEDGDEGRHWGNNYPDSLSQLMLSPCCSEHPDGGAYGVPGFYPNPFAEGDGSSNNAQCLPFGWRVGAAGNFSYITQYNELGNVCAYVLLGYAGSADSGQDIDGDGSPDGVVIMLGGGEPRNQDGIIRRQWSEQQREDAVLMYWDNGNPIVLNWPK